MNQIKKNFIYNVMYQILILILPLITVPYVSRVLGKTGIGIYSYTYSIVYYFMIFGLLGINNYGNRSIAKARDNKEELSKTFFSIYSIQLIMNILMIILYALYIMLFHNEYKLVASIQIIYLLSNMIDINWFFFGLEKFKLTVLRSSIVKIISLILIFTLIKTKNDIWLYTIILSSCSLISNLLLIRFLKKEINFVKITKKDIMKHIKPCILLFIPVIAVSLYKVMDKIMLGMMVNVDEVGLYEQAEKIINIPLGIITALGTVMLPRISNLVTKSDDKKIQELIEKSIKFVMFLSLPICFGLIAISKTFIPLFLGSEFRGSAILLMLLAPTIVFISFANVIRTEYLLPREKDQIYIVSVIGGAIINLIANIILIPILNGVGACIGTILAEVFVCVYQAYKVRNNLTINKYLKDNYNYIIKSIIMFVIVLLITYIDMFVYLKLFISIVVGISIYGLLNIKYISSLIKK